MSESENCTHNCESCPSGSCGDRTAESLLAAPHEGSHVKKVIGVVSGKGGVGKSMVTSLLAVMSARQGFRTAVLDADITGPSIPKAFGLHPIAQGDEKGIYPVESAGGIKVMSLNLLTQDETDPVVWRGPLIGGLVKQFWTDVIWGDVDYMFIDMPPGTGDVPLTVFQSLPVDGIVIVTSPQELVSMIVEKAVKMADLMNIPVLAVVENMSYFQCPNCGEKYPIFGESHIEDLAKSHNIDTWARLPIDPDLARAVDAGKIEHVAGDWLQPVLEKVIK
jgi:Mrp family chromosome partitioning ATPase